MGPRQTPFASKTPTHLVCSSPAWSPFHRRPLSSRPSDSLSSTVPRPETQCQGRRGILPVYARQRHPFRPVLLDTTLPHVYTAIVTLRPDNWPVGSLISTPCFCTFCTFSTVSRFCVWLCRVVVSPLTWPDFLRPELTALTPPSWCACRVAVWRRSPGSEERPLRR